jgi:hypothetical protein
MKHKRYEENKVVNRFVSFVPFVFHGFIGSFRRKGAPQYFYQNKTLYPTKRKKATVFIIKNEK